MNAAIRESGTPGLTNGPDKAFRFALEMIIRARRTRVQDHPDCRAMDRHRPSGLDARCRARRIDPENRTDGRGPSRTITPQVVAKFTASLDRLGGGRGVNNVNGWWKEEFENFGHAGWPKDDDARYRRMDEFVRVMRGLWKEDTFEFHGEFYAVDRQELPLKPIQLPNPPIYAGSRHEPGKEVIARNCDYWFVDCLTDYRTWEQNVEQARATIADLNARAARYGRKLGYGMSCHVVCADTNADAIRLANELEEHGKTSRVSFIAAKALGPGLVGTPATIADRIRRYEAAGVGTLMLHFHPMIEGMERFARDIIPLVTRQTAEYGREPVS